MIAWPPIAPGVSPSATSRPAPKHHGTMSATCSHVTVLVATPRKTPTAMRSASASAQGRARRGAPMSDTVAMRLAPMARGIAWAGEARTRPATKTPTSGSAVTAPTTGAASDASTRRASASAPRVAPLIPAGYRRGPPAPVGHTGAVTRRLAALVVALALSAAPLAPAPPAGAAPLPTFLHLFVVVMENRSYAAAMSDPTVAAIARRGALFTNYYAVAHPSLPNYLAIAGGSTFGVASDCVTCYVSANNLGHQLTAAHVTWAAYLEGAPRPCFLDPYGGSDYAAKHNPFRYFDDVRASRSACAHLRPLTDLAPTLARPAASVPQFVWVTPNLCHDGHDCSTAAAAAWLTSFVDEVTSSPAYRAGAALVITWDEGDGSAGLTPSGRASSTGGGGQVPAIVLSTSTRPGTHVDAARNHYSLLATVEDLFGLTRLGHARGARTLSAAFNRTAALTG